MDLKAREKRVLDLKNDIFFFRPLSRTWFRGGGL